MTVAVDRCKSDAKVMNTGHLLRFLSTGDKLAPGNNGLKDQVELLKWVKNNIEAFGGDPNCVTLEGYSAGGWSNVLHMVSPMSQGLFHKVISMSGAPLGIWPIPRHQLDLAKKQAQLVGCPDDTSENIVKCLKTVPAEQLGESLSGFTEFGWDPILRWSPVIEGDFGQTRFLTDDPAILIKQGKLQKVPFMTGQTKDELLASAYAVVKNATLTREINNDFEKIAPIAFLYERNTTRSREVSRAIRKFYLRDMPVNESQLDNLAKLYTDAIMGLQVNRAAKLVSKYGTMPVYYYCFTFQGRYSHFYLPGTNTVPGGVVHHDDLIYMYYIQVLFPRFGEESPLPEIDMVEKLTTLHANFARTSNPTPGVDKKLNNVQWDRFTMDSQKYLDIGNTLRMKERLFDDRFQFWDKLYPL
nr:venom carboxylesterase-6-like [Leptinotarsa decemlineata]